MTIPWHLTYKSPKMNSFSSCRKALYTHQRVFYQSCVITLSGTRLRNSNHWTRHVNKVITNSKQVDNARLNLRIFCTNNQFGFLLVHFILNDNFLWYNRNFMGIQVVGKFVRVNYLKCISIQLKSGNSCTPYIDIVSGKLLEI